MTARELLDAAWRLMERPPSSLSESWPRSCACLTRTALERAVDEYWSAVAPSLCGRSMRHQLITLRTVAGPEFAGEVSAIWNSLSRAIHHHAYELAPTVDELRDWHQGTMRAVERLVSSAT